MFKFNGPPDEAIAQEASYHFIIAKLPQAKQKGTREVESIFDD